MGDLTLIVTPPADAPIGEYKLSGNHRSEEKVLGKLEMLFNPWCPGRFVIGVSIQSVAVVGEVGLWVREHSGLWL